MQTIIVKTQDEMNAIPLDFKGYIEICSELDVIIKVKEVYDAAKVEAYNSATVWAFSSAKVEAYGSAKVEAYDSAKVEAYDSAKVEAYDSATVWAFSSAKVEAYDSAKVEAYDSAKVEAYNSATVKAYSSATVWAYEQSFVRVQSANARIEHLADWSIARISTPDEITIYRKDDTATVSFVPPGAEVPFHTWIERGIIKADGIYMDLVSRKKIGDTEIYECAKHGFETVFVVRKGDKTSHGDTVEKAIDDLRYKIVDRDTSKYESLNLDSELSIEEAIECYRVITGACEFGVKDFCQTIELPERITIQEIIDRTKEKYGNQVFHEFFNERSQW